MTRTVFCRKLKKESEGLNRAPFPGPKGSDIFENICKEAWQGWLSQQTMLINEKHLNVMDPEAKKYLNEQREHFFNNEATDAIEGYVAPEK